MVIRTLSQNPWETSTRSALVRISTHSLFISTSGPPRHPGSPVVLFFTGGGAPSALYLRLQRLLSVRHRVYFHDRAGYGDSELGPGGTGIHLGTMLTAQTAARELGELLDVIGVAPPYILLSHSYGSICARAFAGLFDPMQPSVAGMVLAESATELMFELFQPSVPPPAFTAIARGVDIEAVTHEMERSRLTDQELAYVKAQLKKSARGSALEKPRLSAKRLLREQQFARQVLGNAPLSVICADFTKDFRLIFEAGVRMGNGTRAEREECTRFFEQAQMFNDELRAGQLRLSGCNRFRKVLEEGHSLPITHPEILVEEVQWVVDHLKGRVSGH
ncbi:alpha/beta fold hydrolase [Aspergillus fijiensis CBS 313.89]|uniref:Alpha/beta-hydrolase n=1 Tax=Aspergillus fijiensis CBS 313.89 TaxID=1448319 RepID=A0A8G1RFQ6_9EURO|nr:alpha/beta-hydrolase [Aspergillus fijiensis CBS 313.89]RAK70975.1 alpha/beta-hydrolase [Aspergillus fijiensis CBS 313.89]